MKNIVSLRVSSVAGRAPLVASLAVLSALISVAGANAQAPQESAPVRLLYLHAFRSPSIGLEYRQGNFGVHAGLYTTILGKKGKSTDFFKTGVTGYFGGAPGRKYEGFFSVAYVRGLSRDYKKLNGAFFEPGIRYEFAKRFEARLGVGVLAAEKKPTKVNPTIGVSYAVPL